MHEEVSERLPQKETVCDVGRVQRQPVHRERPAKEDLRDVGGEECRRGDEDEILHHPRDRRSEGDRLAVIGHRSKRTTSAVTSDQWQVTSEVLSLLSVHQFSVQNIRLPTAS